MIKNLERIKEGADITTVIKRYVELKKQGSQMVGKCPFHEEKSPSFSVNERKGVYNCFGCGASGDTITFLMKYKKMDFTEAVEEMAKIAGEDVQYTSNRLQTKQEYNEVKAQKDNLYIILEKVQRFIVPARLQDTIADYHIELDGRKYLRSTLEKFQIGYHDKGVIFKYREFEHISIEDLVRCGILKASKDRDGHYETFANRSIYTLQDRQGRVVGFAGRKQPGASDKAPKYINSQESPIYNKSKTLYGLYQAEQHIDKADRVILVEGYTDVLTMHENGIQNTVGICGTSVTDEHAKLIEKYTKNVVLLLDGDDAGLTATIRAIEVLSPTLNVFVSHLKNDSKVDPDSFIRVNGVQELKNITASAEDAVVWTCTKDWNPRDVSAQQAAIKYAAFILAKMDDTRRTLYIKKLTEKANFGSVKVELQKAINEELTKKTGNEKVWESDEEQSITTYGIYQRGGCYYRPSGIPGVGVPLTNFAIMSMTLVVGNKESERIVEIKSKSGVVTTARIESDTFTNFGQFQVWIESQGALYFQDGGDKAWGAIRRLVIDKMRTVYPVTKLGQHREGFYVWRNGITTPEGEFQPVADGGLVVYGGVYYMLTFAVSIQNAYADDVSRAATGRYFTYENTAKPDFVEFGTLMQKAYGKKSVVGLAYVMSAVYRDIVQAEEDFFPLLNIFGMPGSGKNKYFEILISLWGSGGKFVDLTNITDKVLPRLMSQANNGLVWLDEYRNELTDEILAYLTNIYNGSGRSMATYDGSNKTTTLDVTCAAIVSGEHRPTRRMALYTRCIAQETQTAQFDTETTAAFEQVRDISRTGALTAVLSQLLRYRPAVKENFAAYFREERNVLKTALTGQRIEDRLIANYAVLCAVARIIENEGFDLPFNHAVLQDECYKGIIHQSSIIGAEDPLATFWRIIAYLYEQKLIQLKADLLFSDESEVTVLIGNKGSETETKRFGEFKSLLFLRLDKAHGLYLEYFQRQFRGQGLALGTLQHYLFSNAAFLGICKAKKFGTSTLRCLVFDLSKIPVEFRQVDSDPL